MPLISTQISDGTIAASSAAMGVAAFAICRALELRPAVAVAVGLIVAFVLYNFGILPIGLYIAVGLAGIGSVWKLITGGSAAPPPVQTPIIALQRTVSPEPDRKASASASGADVEEVVQKNPVLQPLTQVPARWSISPFVVIVITSWLGLALAVVTGVFQHEPKVEPVTKKVTQAPEPTPAELQALTKRLRAGGLLSDAKSFRFGHGNTPLNYAKAMTIYQELANDSDIEEEHRNQAAWALADMLFDGQGIAPSPQLAVKYYQGLVDRKAPGSLPAFRLGLIYEQGLGVPKDLVKAYCFYNISPTAPKAATMIGSGEELDAVPPTPGWPYESSRENREAQTRRALLEKTLTVAELTRAQDISTCKVTVNKP